VRSGDVEFSLGFRVEMIWRRRVREVAKIKLGAERPPNTSGPENHCERKKQSRKRPRRGTTDSGRIFKSCKAAILTIPRKFVLGGRRSLECSEAVAE